MNLATKTIPWMVASLLAVTSIFGQSQNQTQSQGGCAPQPPVCKPVPPPRCAPLQAPQQPMNCAYNAPAEINIGMQGDIDIFASGSFIYWQPAQDNMNIGLTTNNQLTGLAAGATEPAIKGSFIEMDFQYKPGFKVGLGLNLQTDDWDGYAEYTRIHGTHTASSNGPRVSTGAPTVLATWGHPFFLTGGTLGGGQLFNSVSGHYNNNLDFADVEMGRTYYVGKSLVFRSAWGARAAWILQNIHVRYVNKAATTTTDPSTLITSAPSYLNVYQRQHSWALGPRTGLMMDWILGYGIRFFGSGYGDVLYTKYKIQDKSAFVSRTNGLPLSIISRDKLGTIRTHIDLETGFGWGSYFDNNNWHIDLSASYGWQVFFSQNMFRHYENSTVIGINTTQNGDLFVQGLTITARVDF